MGRQSSLATLALGRSPFQEPLLEDDGSFVLGPHAHDLENHDHYVQDFDDRGHPRNRAIKAAARKLRHAKNDVLKTMGVVISRDEAAKTPWQKSTEKQKIDAIVDENEAGLLLVVLDETLTSGLTWWLAILRRRLQVYRSYTGVSLGEVVRSELRILGPYTFFTAGMLSFLLAIPEFILRGLVEKFIARGLSHSAKTGHDTDDDDQNCHCCSCLIQRSSTNFAMSTLFLPNYVFSVLQQLHLIPTSAIFPWRTILPWDKGSPWRTSTLPAAFTLTEVIKFGKVFWLHQAVVGYLFDEATRRLEKAIHRVLICTIDMPDNPDALSQKASRELRARKGIGKDNRAFKIRTFRTTDLLTELRYQFWPIDRAIGFVVGFMQMPILRRRDGAGQAEKVSFNDGDLPDRFWEEHESRQRQYVRDWPSDLRIDARTRLACQRQAIVDVLTDLDIPQPANIDRYLLGTTSVFQTSIEEEIAALDEHSGNRRQTTPADSPHSPGGPTMTSAEPQQTTRDMQLREAAVPTMSVYVNRIQYALRRGSPATLARLSHLIAEENRRESANQLDAITRRSSISSEFPDPPEPNIDPQGNVIPNDGSLEPTHPTAAAGALLPNWNASQTTTSVNGTGVDPTEVEEGAISIDASADEEAGTEYQPSDEANDEDEDNTLLTVSEAIRDSPPPNSSRAPSLQTINAREARNRRIARLRDTSPATPELGRSSALWGGRQPPVVTQDDVNSAREFLSRRDKKHRISALTTYPAVTFADHASSLLATAILLPLESFVLRSLVASFLAHPADRPGAAAAALGLRADLRPLTGWFGGGGDGLVGRLRYAGLMALTLGLQGVISSVSWGLVSGVAIWVGRGYGWGQL